MRPQILIHPEPAGSPGDVPPVTALRHCQGPAIGHDGFEALDCQEGQTRLVSGQICGTGPVNAYPRALRQVGQDRKHLASRNALTTAGPEGDAKEADAGAGIGDAFRDQGQLWPPYRAVHLHQLDTVADGPDRVDKVMADTRADQRAEVWTFGHVPSYG